MENGGKKQAEKAAEGENEDGEAADLVFEIFVWRNGGLARVNFKKTLVQFVRKVCEFAFKIGHFLIIRLFNIFQIFIKCVVHQIVIQDYLQAEDQSDDACDEVGPGIDEFIVLDKKGF